MSENNEQKKRWSPQHSNWAWVKVCTLCRYNLVHCEMAWLD